MFPGFSQLNTGDGLLANAIYPRQLILSQPGSSNFMNIGNGELSMFSISTLVDHVFHVLGMGAHRKMLWINARRVIARVHDLHAFWNPFLVFQNPGNSVGHVHFAPVRNAKLALASNILGCQPKPTFVGRSFFYFVPKSDLKFFIKHGQYVHFDKGNIKF